MSACNMLFFMLVFVQIMTQIGIVYSDVNLLPECDDEFIEPTTPDNLATKYKLEGDKAFVWFCPGGLFSSTREIDVFSCASGDDSSCLRKTETVSSHISRMNECKDWLSYFNFRKRVLTCMPWEINPKMQRYAVEPPWASLIVYKDFIDREKTGMRHLRTQFLRFKPLWQWYETPPKSQDASVPRCDSSADDILFANQACWHSDAEVLFLKPRYKFKFIQSDNKKLCVLSNTVLGTDILSFNSESITYTPQPTTIRKKFTNCKWWGKDMRMVTISWIEYVVRKLMNDAWQTKQIQYHDYKHETTSTPCMDSVTEPCVDNVFSFFAKECVWVHKTGKDKPISLSSMLWPLGTEDKENFETYGDQTYVMNLDGRNIEVWVKLSDAHRYEKWNGHAKKMDPRTTSLYFTEAVGYSCSACQSTSGVVQAGSPAFREAPCGVPQKCDTCDPWERVDTPWRDTWSKCNPSFAERRCTACPIHHERSSLKEEQCVSCPALKPMRREGQITCALCEHTQWFNPLSPSGCLYFMSVADGISFAGGTRFDKTYVDQYKPIDSSRPPQEVPALHYRNLVTDGNSWNASTSAEMCAPGSFAVVNASVAGVFTRNVQGRRMQFRRWCGHAEILKADDVLMQPLDCGNRRSGNATSLSELVSGSAGMYTLVKERRFVSNLNRMGEVKLTMLSDGFSCYYELRREGRAEDCRYCSGTMYTQGCGPTYYPELTAPAVAGPGTCAPCEEQCSSEQFPNYFFSVTQFSCWSNGTERVWSGADFGSLRSIAVTMSANMNYWYKPAACLPCAKLSDEIVPRIVTRCGNKVWFETWHPTEVESVLDVNRPKKRFCCAMDNTNYLAGNVHYDSEIRTRCVGQESALFMQSATPLCQKTVPDLATNYTNFCPPGWFLDRSAPGCAGTLTAWNNACCSQCDQCRGAGRIKTDKYKTCSGNTEYDTQLQGCVTSCAEKNYEVDGTCVACESCA